MANLVPATAAVRANTAGVKQEANQIKNQAQAEVPAVVNPFYDAASFLHLTGGPHPESLPSVVSTALSRATDAVRGPHGGTIAPTTSVTAPGPVGGINAQAGNRPAPVAKLDPLPRLRRLFGKPNG